MIYLFRKIVFDCKEATRLSIKKEEGKITFVEQLKLRYHLLYCDPCRRFIRQWNLLQPIGKNVTSFNEGQPLMRLSDEAREKIHKLIGQK